MNRVFPTGRGVVLLLSAALAMPWATKASYVRGGDNSNCTTVNTSDGKCGHTANHTCAYNKVVCNGCPSPSDGSLIQYKCVDGAEACKQDTTGCTKGQHDSDESGDCVHIS